MTAAPGRPVPTAPGRPVPRIEGEGTPEARWQAWPGFAFPPWSGWQTASRLVVVAPHPDDEVLAVGGSAALAARAGIPVVVVACTDGGASHPGSPTLTPAVLAERRVVETAEALAVLGLASAEVHRLGLPDGGLPAAQEQVTDELHALLRPDDVVVTTWRGDGHPDHEAVGRATASATAEVGASLVEALVWTWHWAEPGDPGVPWERARSVALPDDVTAAKRAAARCFRTQVEPLSDAPEDAAVLPPPVLARLVRPVEVVLVAEGSL